MIAQGAHIKLRDAIWRVTRIDTTSNGKQAWTCVGVSEIVRDQNAVFLQELEPGVKVLLPEKTELKRDESSQHRAGLLYIESLLRDVPPTGPALVVGHKAAMRDHPFQLMPAYKSLGKLRQRILIADAVGLGKTLTAGVLLAELIRRGRGRRILVATVKSVMTQFQKEMWCRFSIPLVRLDSTGLQRIRAQIPSHHNPFSYYDKSIISIDTLKQGGFIRNHVEQEEWDVIVIDEAHNVAKRGHSKSQRADIADVLADRCDSMILLSATPHDGRAQSFASLMNMLDPTAIANPKDYTADEIRGMYWRRFRAQVAHQLGGAFPDRKVYKRRGQASDAEEEAYNRLTALEFTRIDKRTTSTLFKTTLEKALFSSPAACLATIDTRCKNIARKDTAHLYDQDLEKLHHLRQAVEAIDIDSFSKYQELLRVIREQMEWKPRKAKTDRLVIFTERRKTLRFLEQHLPKDLGLSKKQVAILHGSLSDKELQLTVEAFGNETTPLRLLLATDVASEGINLHFQCHRLIHFDIPWSLMVFQQRNGRVDRYGQKEQPLLVYLLTESKNKSIDGDQRILEVLVDKDKMAHKNIDDPSAFMNVHDILKEEKITADTMVAGETAKAFSDKLQARLANPFARKLADGAMKATGDAQAASKAHDAPKREDDTPQIQQSPSLYEDDFDYTATALKHLAAAKDIRFDARPTDRLIELTWTPDLKKRFDKLPLEVRPDDGVILLTASRKRMMDAIDEARKAEHAWPAHQFLWANNPVVTWLGDQLRSSFGRHAAPVLTLEDVVAPDEVAIIVSGLMPNKRSQPLVHSWYVVRFKHDAVTEVTELSQFLKQSGLDGSGSPNPELEVDIPALKKLLPKAIDRVTSEITRTGDHFQTKTRVELDEELARLDRLRTRQLQHIADKYGGDERKTQRRSDEERAVKGVFENYEEWAAESMTPSDEPFIQVIAAICHPEGDYVR